MDSLVALTLAQVELEGLHPVAWVLVVLSGLVVLGMVAMGVQHFLFYRRQRLNSPARVVGHHAALLMEHAGGQPGFAETARSFASFHLALVPDSGRAETVQGEVVRAVDRLASEYRRNGNLNWDERFEEWVEFLRSHLLRDPVFSPEESAEWREQLDVVWRNGSDAMEPDLVDKAFAGLIRAAVLYCERHEASQSRRRPQE